MRSSLAAVGLLSVLLLTSCSSPEQVASNQARPGNRPANPVSSTNAAPGEPANASATSQSPVNEPAQADTAANIRRSRIDAIRKDAVDPNTPKLDVETLLQRSARPAPENSDFAVALTDIVVERRTFHDDPQLLKVERITQGEKKTLKIYLKNGKVVELPGDRLASIATAASATILKTAGFTTPPPSTVKRNSKIVDR